MHILGALQNPTFRSVQLSHLDFWLCRNTRFPRIFQSAHFGALENPTFRSVQLSDKHKANPTIFLISGFVELLVFLGFSKAHILGALQKSHVFVVFQLSDMSYRNPTISLISGFVEILVFLGFSRMHIWSALKNPTFCSFQLSARS